MDKKDLDSRYDELEKLNFDIAKYHLGTVEEYQKACADVLKFIHRATQLLVDARLWKAQGKVDVIVKDAAIDNRLNMLLATDEEVASQKSEKMRTAFAMNKITDDSALMGNLKAKSVVMETYVENVKSVLESLYEASALLKSLSFAFNTNRLQ